jgi:hypothetical protein
MVSEINLTERVSNSVNFLKMKIFIFHSNFNAVFCKKLILTSYICKCIYESLKDLNCFILEKGPNSEILNDITEILLKVLLNTIKVDIDLGYCSPNHSKQALFETLSVKFISETIRKIHQHMTGSSKHYQFKEKNPHQNWMNNTNSIFL